MDYPLCNYQSCTEHADVYCECTEPLLYFCFNHINEHNNDQRVHKNEMIYTGISIVHRRLIQSKINQILVRSKELKKKIITEAKRKFSRS